MTGALPEHGSASVSCVVRLHDLRGDPPAVPDLVALLARPFADRSHMVAVAPCRLRSSYHRSEGACGSVLAATHPCGVIDVVIEFLVELFAFFADRSIS